GARRRARRAARHLQARRDGAGARAGHLHDPGRRGEPAHSGRKRHPPVPRRCRADRWSRRVRHREGRDPPASRQRGDGPALPRLDREEPARAASRRGVELNPTIFREYDIRGIADRDFDAGFARQLGRTYGTLALEHGAERVSVGRDCRLTSDAYAAALVDGLCSTGLGVVELGVVTTPLVYFSIFHWNLDGAIQITGSHNPSDYNGFKLCLGRDALHGEQIQDLRRRLEAGAFRRGAGAHEKKSITAEY